VYSNITSARPNSPVEELFNLRCPLLSFYGNEDPQVPKEQVRALESRLSHNPNRTYYEIVRYPGVGHGFLVPGRQGFNAQAAQASEEKVRDFLARYLRAEPKKDE
jgi:dienelactone hydrolase